MTREGHKGHFGSDNNILFLNFFLIYFGLHCVFVAVHGLSLVAEGGGYSLFAVFRLKLIAVVSLVAKHGL